MGLSVQFLEDLIALKRRGFSVQRVAEIGAQQLSDQFLSATKPLADIYRLYGRERVGLGQPAGAQNFTKSAPQSVAFWQSLGIECVSIDLAEDAIKLDLNRDTVPREHCGRFDLVINAGTTEHVANQDNAFRIIHDLTRNGGIMWHEVPAFTFGHGLVNYSPKLFIQLVRQNAYEPLFIRVSRSADEKVPRYIEAMNRRWGDGHAMDFTDLPSLTIRAAMRRTTADAFVTPLDLPRSLMVKSYLRSPRSWKYLLPLK